MVDVLQLLLVPQRRYLLSIMEPLYDTRHIRADLKPTQQLIMIAITFLYTTVIRRSASDKKWSSAFNIIIGCYATSCTVLKVENDCFSTVLFGRAQLWDDR